MTKKTNKWMDRGWWVSVEIDRKPAGRKNEDLVLNLLDGAGERYDLHFENGKVVSRGIFTRNSDMLCLARLLELAGHWAGTMIYSKGDLLKTGEFQQLTRLLRCAANQAICRSDDRVQRLAFLGCHLLKIGLMNYSLAALKDGKRFWFSYLKSEKGDGRQVYLQKSALTRAIKASASCPLFPVKTLEIIQMLPSTVNLTPVNDSLFWVPTSRRVRTHWLCRFPPVVPNCESAYKQWIGNLLKRISDD